MEGQKPNAECVTMCRIEIVISGDSTVAMFKIQQEANAVSLWAKKRLPFEPEGEMLDARAQLRAGLSKFGLCSGEHLEAEFHLAGQEYFDLENVLFYNVGTSSFSRLLAGGLQARIVRQLPPLTIDDLSYPYLQKYSLASKSCEAPNETPTLSFELPGNYALAKADPVWWAASQGTCFNAEHITGCFGMVVEYPTSRFRIHSAMKPLLDGIIAAMHAGKDVDPMAVERLAKKNSWDLDKAKRCLESPTCPVLGPRKVLHLYREYVKWDPADDRCTEFQLVPTATSTSLIRVWMYETKG